MSSKKIALLIIDMQNDFVLEDAPFRVKGALDAVGNMEKVLQYFRKNDFPIFHVIRIHRKDGCDVEITRKDIFLKTPFAVEGSKGAEIVDELKPMPREYVIRKKRMSAFLNTDIDLILKRLDIEDVVVIGVQTPNCIRATAFDAVAYGYNAWLVEDAVAAQTKEIHKANVLDMKNIGIKVIRTEQIENLFTC
jgi:nicotinamidase-related amidase